MRDFIGVKIALIHNDELLVIQRDDIPGLRFAGMWDFAGGGNEPGETRFECIRREVFEELGIDLDEKEIIWEKAYPSIYNPELDAHFMLAHLTEHKINNITLGTEGQRWTMMTISDFLNHPNAIELLKLRIRDYLDATN